MLSSISGDDKDHEFQILVKREIKLNCQQDSHGNCPPWLPACVCKHWQQGVLRGCRKEERKQLVTKIKHRKKIIAIKRKTISMP